MAGRLGVVGFATGPAQPERIPTPAALVAQERLAARKPGHVVLLRGGTSPIGSASFNFVLSGERVAAIRNRLAPLGIPCKKIVSQFVEAVDRGSTSADRAVIVDATIRHALGMAPARTGEGARLAQNQ